MAVQLKGKTVKGSGNQPMNPGDVKLKDFLVEAKITRSNQYILKAETIDKIRSEAYSINRDWVMVIEINGLEIAVVDFKTLKEVLT